MDARLINKDDMTVKAPRPLLEKFVSLAGRLRSFVLPFTRERGVSNGRKAEVMTAIYRSILSSESVEESIERTISAFRENFTFSKVSITLFNFEACTFTPYGINARPGSPAVDRKPYPLELFPLLHVLLQHKTCLVQDLAKKETLSEVERNALHNDRVRSYFLCPLVGKGELLGSLNFASIEPYAFPPETVSFCEEVANGIAISFHQFNLQEKIRLINSTLERKEKDITDSINYARRIQLAKLPTPEQIQDCVADCFVLYKPKDIVSGDFYYFRKHKGAVFVAAADCTGHGVPGALMSMLCSENLDDAIPVSADPSVILSQLNKKIKYSLQQSENQESSRDGMDICLCTIDTGNSLVKFAGANRPLWYIRKGEALLHEIRGTKMSIGGFTDDAQRFDTHWLKFKAGDIFYLVTDGYADTFGGTTNKKLMTRRFKELLVGMREKSMEEQRSLLEDFIENWKAGREQVDDILVIGVRM